MDSAKGCDCKPRPEIGVTDWNDIAFIFKARLVAAKKTVQFGSMTFDVVTEYKGTLPTDSITFYYQPYTSHTLLHAVKDFTAGKEWIIFARQEKVGQRIYYRLVDTDNDHFCALSRPLLKNKDAYLFFLDYMAETANGYRQFYDTEGHLLSEGEYHQKVPKGQWKYYWKERLIYEGAFLKGKKNGHWLTYTYSRKGKQVLAKKETYENGKVKKTFNYHLNGDLRWTLEITDHQKTYSYYRNNNLDIKRVSSLEDKTSYIAYYKKGKLVREEHFN
ncbi:MAG: antitoxin component YwqK of YwqJK toxin-antitoxin module [Gammaproteobacteria bacterium]|jgi:antitoxin component YwqK of YwqJK toxin-antitoxin module